MKMVAGDVNIYYFHNKLTPENVRAASYSTQQSSGTLVPQVGDVIEGFHGWDAVEYRYEQITVEVTRVREIGVGVQAFEVYVKSVD